MTTKILIADDSKENLKLWEICLRPTGLTPILASDGEEAIVLFDSNEIAAAVLDLNMPKKDGYEVIEHIKSKAKDCPVIASTGEDCGSINEQLESAGFDDYFEKPFDFKTAVAKLHSHVKARMSANASV